MNKSICHGCSNAFIYTRETGDMRYRCAAGAEGMHAIPDDVVKCTYFHEKSGHDLYEMKAIAWRLRTDRSGTAMGFAPPSKKRDDFDD